MVISYEKAIIYFGDASDQINKKTDCNPDMQSVIDQKKYVVIAQKLGIGNIALLHQIHSNDGIHVTDSIPAFNRSGDFLITSQLNIGLGVLTADCLPIVIYDPAIKKVGIIHAGWRGSINDIIFKALAFFSDTKKLTIFFGPSANVCCYQVSESFKEQIKERQLLKLVLQKKEDQHFFDLPLYNQLLFAQAGIAPQQIISEYNVCTMCNANYFSHRRDSQNLGRQISVVALKEN